MEREICYLAKLDHPNIINYVESFGDDKNMLIVTDYIEGAHDLKLLVEACKEMRRRRSDPLLPYEVV